MDANEYIVLTPKGKLVLLLQSRRAELGLTQRQLGDRIGVAAQTVCLWENGNSIPAYRYIPKLSKVLKIPVRELGGLIAQARQHKEA